MYEAYLIIQKEVELSAEANLPGMGQVLSEIEDGSCSRTRTYYDTLIKKILSRAKDRPHLRQILRQFFEPRINSIFRIINEDLISLINTKLEDYGKKGLVVIVDNLDRLNTQLRENGKTQQEYIFFDRIDLLCKLSCHLIYTFPIALRFSGDYLKFAQRFGKNIEIITPVPVKYNDGQVSGKGMFVMKQLILSRAFPDLEPQERLNRMGEVFEDPKDLGRICQMSGGHPRLLLVFVTSCLKKGDLPISQDALEEVIHKRRSEISLAITEEEWEVIQEVDRNSNVVFNENKKALVNSLSIFEYQYRGETWFEVNPLLRSSLESRSDYEIFDSTLLKVQNLLEKTGAITQKKKRWLKVKSFIGPLTTYTPLPVMFFESPTEGNVIDLIQYIDEIESNHIGHNTVGLLFYNKPPNTLAIFKIAQARVRDHKIIIPVPFSALEQASLDESKAVGLISHYVCRYMPGANLFNDRNAISDSLSFYGRSNLLNVLEQDLSRFQSVGIFGLRKSGKTSVLLQLALSMRHHPVVHIDLQPFAGKTCYGAELFNQIIQRLLSLTKGVNSSHFGFTLFDETLPTSSLTTQFARKISQLSECLSASGYERPIVCFLDEIERILPTEFDPPAEARARIEEFNAVFGTLRALNQEQHLLSLLVADLHPDCNSINHWHLPGLPTNPVYQFFKEVFVTPFFAEDTEAMLTQIGQLMGIKFEDELVNLIHQESGGHPFVSRQLASLLYTRVKSKQKTLDGELITKESASRYIDRPFSYSDLGDYFDKNIWDDLLNRQRRGYAEAGAAMDILKVLSCNDQIDNGICLEVLLDSLADTYSKSECERVLRWLEAVGLVKRLEFEDNDNYVAKVPLMSKWLRRTMRPEEVNQWKIA
ncbi:MAG: ATP-binding protein [Cyanobacteria bacterium P01_A01_bin.17]